jgi:hypothetical protein
MKVWCLVAVSLFLLFNPSVNAEENQWLGTYSSPNIPGYEIVESALVTAEYSGPQRAGVPEEVRHDMENVCRKPHGIALVNVSLMPAIGEARSVTSSGQSRVYSPGLHVVGLADCVQKVTKASR